MKSITEARLLSFLGGKSLNRLQVKVEVQMKVIQIFTVNQQIQHVVTLSDYLKCCLNPVELSHLEELSFCKSFKKRSFALRLWCTVVQLIQNPYLEEFLVRYTHFDRVSLRTSLLKPWGYEWDIIASSGRSSSFIERLWCPVKINCTDCPLIK